MEFLDCLYFAFCQSYRFGSKRAKRFCPNRNRKVRSAFLRVVMAYFQEQLGEPELGDPARAQMRRLACRVLRIARPCLYGFQTNNRSLQLSRDPSIRDFVNTASNVCVLGPLAAAKFVMTKLNVVSMKTVERADDARFLSSEENGQSERQSETRRKKRRRVFWRGGDLEETCRRVGWLRTERMLRASREKTEKSEPFRWDDE